MCVCVCACVRVCVYVCVCACALMVPHLQVKGKSRTQSVRTAATERIKKVSTLQRTIGDKIMYAV